MVLFLCSCRDDMSNTGEISLFVLFLLHLFLCGTRGEEGEPVGGTAWIFDRKCDFDRNTALQGRQVKRVRTSSPAGWLCSNTVTSESVTHLAPEHLSHGKSTPNCDLRVCVVEEKESFGSF